MPPRYLLRASLGWLHSQSVQLLLRWLVVVFFLLSAVNGLFSWPETYDFYHVGHRFNWIWPMTAVVSVGAELVLPIFLIVGLLPRLSLCGLMLINTVAIFCCGTLVEGGDATLQLRLIIEAVLALQLYSGREVS